MRDSAGRSQFSRLAQYVLNAQGRSNPATWSRTADYVLDTAHQGAKVGQGLIDDNGLQFRRLKHHVVTVSVEVARCGLLDVLNSLKATG